MQSPSSSLAATPKMQGLNVSGTWYVGQDAASLRTYWVYTPSSYKGVFEVTNQNVSFWRFRLFVLK